jgi:hypothetical protein
MRRRLVNVLTVAAAVCALGAPVAYGSVGPNYQPSPTAALTMKTFCGYGTIVLNFSYSVSNDTDYGVLGDPWAADDYTHYVQVIQTGWNTYCAATRYSGSFTTKAGLSPGLTNVLPSGITGVLGGGDRFVFQGTRNSGLPTSGSIGSFDYSCDAASSTCPQRFDWLSQYFRDVSNFRMLWWAFGYNANATGHGIWANRMDYSAYDITG